MAELNKAALTSENNNSFPNNNTGFITPDLLRTFNQNMIDSMVDEITYNADSASVSASIAQLKGFSSSLDATYATDAQLSASASTLQNNINLKVNTSSTSSMTVLSSSYSVSSSFSLTASYAENAGVFNTSSLVTTASFNAYTASQTVISASFNQRIDNLDPSGSAEAIDALNLFTSSQYVSNSLFVQTSQTSSMSVLSSSYALTASFAENVGDNYATTGSNTFIGNQIISGNLNISGSEVVTGPLTASRLQINGVTDLNGTLDVLNDATFRGDVLIQSSGEQKLKMRSTSGGGVSQGFDLLIQTSSFIIKDETHDIDFFEFDYNSGSTDHTLKLEANRFELNSGSLGVSGSFTASLAEGYVWVGGVGNVSTAISTASFARTGSNTFIGNQIISGALLVSGNFDAIVQPAELSIGVSNVNTVIESTASGVPSTIDVTRTGAGPTGDLSGVRLQTLSGSDTTGDTLLSRISTGVNRHTSTAMTGSVVNTTITSTWATGSGGTRVAYGTTINANAQSQSATLTLSAGNSSLNNVGGTASIAAGLIRIGTNAAHTISTTGSFGPLVIAGTVANPAISVRSGSVEITTPQGSGSFYSNVPITSSGLRINGDGRFSGIEVIALGGANGSGSLFVQNAVTASSISASQYIGLPSGIISASSQISNLGYAITGSNTFVENQTINAQLIVSSSNGASFINGGLLLQGDNAGGALTIYSGSVSVNTPQGQGFFYSNLPITSSAGRFNGQSFIKRLNIEDNGGSAHLQVENNASVSGSFTSVGAITGSVISASQYIGFIQSASIAQTASFLTPNQTLSGATTLSGSVNITGSAPTQQWVSGGLTLSGSLVSNVTDIYTGSNNANFIITLGSASMASLIAAGTTNVNTLYFVI
jgi:hypothetical protein